MAVAVIIMRLALQFLVVEEDLAAQVAILEVAEQFITLLVHRLVQHKIMPEVAVVEPVLLGNQLVVYQVMAEQVALVKHGLILEQLTMLEAPVEVLVVFQVQVFLEPMDVALLIMEEAQDNLVLFL